jgi:hypothetical protein
MSVMLPPRQPTAQVGMVVACSCASLFSASLFRPRVPIAAALQVREAVPLAPIQFFRCTIALFAIWKHTECA